MYFLTGRLCAGLFILLKPVNRAFKRDLTQAEIIGQLWMANYSYMEDVPVAERERSVTNVVMMGMGRAAAEL